MRTLAAGAALIAGALLFVWERQQPAGSAAREVRYEAIRRQPSALTASFAPTSPASEDEDGAENIPPALREIQEAPTPQEDDESSPPPPPPQHSLIDGCTAATSGCERGCRARRWSVHCQRCECARCSFCAADASSSSSSTSSELQLPLPPPPPPPPPPQARSASVSNRGRGRGRRRRKTNNNNNGRRGLGRGRGGGRSGRGGRSAANGSRGRAGDSYDYDDEEEEEEEEEGAQQHRRRQRNHLTNATAASNLLALGVLTQSKTSPRFASLAFTWLPHFQPYVMVFESNTDVSRVQQVCGGGGSVYMGRASPSSSHLSLSLSLLLLRRCVITLLSILSHGCTTEPRIPINPSAPSFPPPLSVSLSLCAGLEVHTLTPVQALPFDGLLSNNRRRRLHQPHTAATIPYPPRS